MIDLLSRDESAALGLQTLLDVERIPYQRITDPTAAGPGVLLVTGDGLSDADLVAIERSTALVVGGGPRCATELFDASDARTDRMPVAIGLDEPIWPAAVAGIARAHGVRALRLPRVDRCATRTIGKGTVLARTAGGDVAAARRNGCVWTPIDLGTAMIALLTERDRPRGNAESGARDGRLRRIAESAYYAAPGPLRRWVQRRSYAALESRLDAVRDRATDYPIDATAWLLLELLKALLRASAGTLVRVARWPAPYQSAAALTHDVEPRRFAYRAGLDRLLAAVAQAGHPATFGLVAGSATRWLDDASAHRLKAHDTLVHGLEHRGENVDGRTRVQEDLRQARAQVERRLGRSVAGYRSPRLDRSPDLAWALDATGFRWDSSFPDVDRENLAHFGGGVTLSLPYRPPIEDADGRLRPSRCLELPLTAPDCVQPLFAGGTVEELRRTVEAKAAWIRATGGLYVALVHGGVFGHADAELRAAHLAFVRGVLGHADTWLASMAEIAEWWERREAVRVALHDRGVHVRNRGTQPIVGVRVLVERDGVESVLALPGLPAGAEITLASPRSRDLPAA